MYFLLLQYIEGKTLFRLLPFRLMSFRLRQYTYYDNLPTMVCLLRRQNGDDDDDGLASPAGLG